MAAWTFLRAGPPSPLGGERLTLVRRAGAREFGWTWVGDPPPGAGRAAGTEPGSELAPDRRVWGTRADAEARNHLGLLDDEGEVSAF
jgi:hypothetical protein